MKEVTVRYLKLNSIRTFTLSSLLCSVECWRWFVTDYWVISYLIVVNVNCSWKHFLLFCLLKQRIRLSIGRYWLSADNWCTSSIQPLKNWVMGCWHGSCLEQSADLHMAQLMPLPVTVSCFSKIQIGLPFWYRLTRVFPDKGLLHGCVCVCGVWISVKMATFLYALNVAGLCICMSTEYPRKWFQSCL